MTPPISIDGTDITGATIDGTDVQEITVDGQTVFSAGPSNFPVAYSNLVAWYPFDSATYGGSNADDVTAILGGSGDDTAYDGTVSGATYQSSGGGTDINAGANSGAFDFDGSNDEIDFGSIPSVENVSQITAMCWVNLDAYDDDNIFGAYPNFNDNMTLSTASNGELRGRLERSGTKVNVAGNTIPIGTWQHVAFTYNAGSGIVYQDGVQTGTDSGGPSTTPSSGQEFYAGYLNARNNYVDAEIDDCRLYDTELTSSQISQIVSNTPH